MWLADLHVHSNFSDGKMSIAELVDFYGSRGFGCIAVTDHICEEKTFLGKAAEYLNRSLSKEKFPLYIETIEREAKRAMETYGLLLIPGVELTKNSLSNHRSAHILGLGIRQYIAADGEIVDLARTIRTQGGVAIAAHPVSTGHFEFQTYHLWGRRQELAKEFDAWEVASGPVLFSEVLKSGLPMIASSDLHHTKQINSWKTQFHCERTEEAVFAAIRAQELEFKFYCDPLKEEIPRFVPWAATEKSSSAASSWNSSEFKS